MSHATGSSNMQWNPGQTAAIGLEGRDLLITAGAGTGKTSVLVERILRKLRSGEAQDLESLLVVTFTDKAAQEMKERIHKALVRDRDLRRFLPQLPRATISTIHGFCARLLREQFLLAGVDPGFKVLDENGSTEALEEALRKTFHDWYLLDDEDGAEFRRLVELAGFDENGEQLREIVRRLYAYARSTPDPDLYLDRLSSMRLAEKVEDLPWYGAFLQGIEREWTDGFTLYEAAIELAIEGRCKCDRHRTLLDALRSFDPFPFEDEAQRLRKVRALEHAGHVDLAEGLQILFPKAPTNSGKIPGFKELHDAGRKILKESRLLDRLTATAGQLLEDQRYQKKTLSVLVRLVRQMDEHYDRYKKRGGRLDYSDLEVRAARFLQANGERLQLSDRFSEILVDEYQDVNGLQESILSAVSRPGRRFRVGDVKQSIYQFRLADPSIFLRHARTSEPVRGPEDVPLGDGPLAIYLTENHRSRPEILGFVNRIFGELFDPETIGSEYAEQALVPAKEASADPCPVELHIVDHKTVKGEDKDEDVPDLNIAEAQARLTALRLKAMSDDPILAGDDGEADWSRAAVLLRTRTRAQTFVEALQREGVPAYIGEGGSLLDEPSVRDLYSLLQVIDNPRNDVALAAALRSPLFGIDDSDLLRIRLAYPDATCFLDAAVGVGFADSPAEAIGMFVPPSPSGEEDSFEIWVGPPREGIEEIIPSGLAFAVKRSLRRIAEWRRIESTLELGRFLLLLIEEFRFSELSIGGGEGVQQQACLDKFLGLARAYELERGPSLRGYLARLEALERAGGIDSVPAAGSSAVGVRILTIHKAKGLEFPVVVVPQLDWRFYGKDRLASRIRIGKDWVGIRRFDPEQFARLESLARQVLEFTQEERLREEEARVLYVALTRAQERLVLVTADTKAPWSRDRHPILDRIRRRRASNTWEWIWRSIPWDRRASTSNDLITKMGLDRSTSESGDDSDFIADEPDALGDPEPVGQQTTIAELHLNVTFVPKKRIALAGEGDPELEPAVNDEPGASPRKLVEPEAAPIRLGTQLRLAIRDRSEIAVQPGVAERKLVDELFQRIERVSERPPLARIEILRGKYWVTEFKTEQDRQIHRDVMEEAGTFWVSNPEPDPTPNSGAERGIRYHMGLSRLDLTRSTPAELDAQWAAFARESWWRGAERSQTLEEGVASFLSSPLGSRLVASAARGKVEREVPFSLKWPLERLVRYMPKFVETVFDPRWSAARWNEELGRSWVLLQGRIDCLFEDERSWTVIDWKTDRVRSGAEEERVDLYRSQMSLYVDAVRSLWGSPVDAHLSFLWTGTAVPLTTIPMID